MEQDIIDGLTMVPGILGVYWLAWSSDDFVYRIAVLSWGWTCMCSMFYHFNKCKPHLLKYDQRAQWVAQVFMTLETPQTSWPIIIGGLAPVGWKGRAVLNGVGALWFARHQPVAIVLLLLSYTAYIIQFPTGLAWMHSVFHMLLHAAGGVVALNPVKKYVVPIHAYWAWPVWLLGAWLLVPPKEEIPYYRKNEWNLVK